ncbi:MAG: hypothetical protein ACRDS9_03865 [Pseudonocardiaceae bacterium]
MSRGRANYRHIREGVNFELSGGDERVIRAAMRSWAATLRLCLIVSVVAATSTITVWTERVVQAAMRSWAATLRLCFIVSVVVAILTVVVWLAEPAVLLFFTE